ncbi:MAG: ABC transporter substrate-binding protein [Promethearchaeota archaeon]|jgi:ABC-type transport system substrate-binding protein
MEMEKKNLAIIILAVVLAASGVGNIILGIQTGVITIAPEDKETLIVGTLSGPVDLDPVDSWDSASWDIIRQCVEGLLFYNLSDPDLTLTPWLAESFTFVDTTHINFNLRTGVTFHDGTAFNADAVVWNFDRLLHFMNHSGTLAGGLSSAKIHSLFEFADGSPVIASMDKTGEYTVQLVLNGPYTSILGLLSFAATGMLSPTYHEAQGHLDAYIDTSADKLVGTGPFEYVEYVTDDFVKLTGYDDYWMEPTMFDELIFDVIDDSTTRNYAMLAGDIDYLFGSQSDLWDTFNASPWIHFEAIDRPGLSYSYMGINNKQINVTWRKAISYAVNYTYILDEMWQGAFVKSYGPVSPGYSAYFDPTTALIAPYFNLTIARQTLIDDPGVDTGTLTANSNDEDTNWEAANLRNLNYSYNTDNWFRADLYVVLSEWLEDIGIALEDGGTDWAYFLYRAYGYVPGGYDELQLYWVGWGPDYQDPMNMIQPLFTNNSVSNSAQVNDHWLETKVAEYYAEPLEANRIQIIKDLSNYIAGTLYPHVFGYHPQTRAVHAADLYNVAYNVAGNWWAYPIQRNLTWSP